MSLHGRVALVTGATSGIGLGIAHALAGAGADLMLSGFGEAAAIEQSRAEIAQRHGVRVRHSPADMADPAQVRAMLTQTHGELGRLDILVNNAGIQHTAPTEAFPEAQWDRIIAINLSGAFHAIKAAIPLLRAQGWGRIINIASAHGLVGSAEKSAYVAAKHGLVGLTKVVAIELAEHAITVNAICPGWVLTPLVQAQIEANPDPAAAAAALLAEKQPLRRFTTPGQIGALAVFLCSDAAATLTGASLPIDGGWTAR
ncbi:3-hydroxybutyrate dehydrogenase [Lichenicoccus sp.]|uniref:3-hydroxybutyrate dehydrogenase n=1 Tax=Lichenicoccus sp. TaxID=2781899 RepID=UPI003D0C9B29